MEPYIELPYGAPGESFSIDYLITHLQETGRDYIIQGQCNCCLEEHPKPNSLDAWLRKNFTSRQDKKQATNNLLHMIVKAGPFREGWFICPDTGRRCKGIKLIKSSKTNACLKPASVSRVSDIQPN